MMSFRGVLHHRNETPSIKALFPGGGGIGGVPLDSHDKSRIISQYRVRFLQQESNKSFRVSPSEPRTKAGVPYFPWNFPGWLIGTL